MRCSALGLDAILIINVKDFVERRRHVEAQLARFGLRGEFMHDFDADEITPELDRRWFAGVELNRGQKSCALKHIAVLQRVVERGWQHCLVLEDDVVLADEFLDGVRAALSETRDQPRPYIDLSGRGR